MTGAAPGPPGEAVQAGEAAAAGEAVEAGEVIELANEFASVVVRRVRTRNGVRLRIESPRQQRSIDLDPLELECLTGQEHELFSELLAHPFGPEDADG